MKRNLLINSFFITFGIIFALSAQDKSPKNVEKNMKVIIKDGKVIMDTVTWNKNNDQDIDFISMEDSTVNVFVIKEGHGNKKKVIEIRSNKGGPEKEVHIETIVDEDGDSTLVKSFIISDGFDKDIEFNMPNVPMPPHLPHFNFSAKNSDPVDMLLNDPHYEILDYDKKVKKGVETIKIRRRKTE